MRRLQGEVRLNVMFVISYYAQGLGAERCTRVRLVAGTGARARGADEHVVLFLLAVCPGVLLLVDPGTVVLDGLAFERRGPIHGVLEVSPVDLARLLSVLLQQACKGGVFSRANVPRRGFFGSRATGMKARDLSRVNMYTDTDSRNSVLALSSFLCFAVAPRGGPIHPLPHYDVGTNMESYQRQE